MADRIAVMHDGRIEQIGTPVELYEPADQPLRGGVPRRDQLHRGAGDRAERWVLGGAVGGGGDPDLAPDGIAAGSQAAVSVRPESIWIACNRAATEDVNRIEGVLLDTVYLGEFAQYEVEIVGGTVVKVLQQNPKAAPPEAGKKVVLEFSPADAIVLA